MKRSATSSKQAHSCNYTPPPPPQQPPLYFALCQIFSTKTLTADQDTEPLTTCRKAIPNGNFKVGMKWLTIG